jgi:endonuclease/exonuclease/phosphatase family metal-dependent hydrolase
LKNKFSDFDVYESSILKTTDIFTLNNVGYYNEKSNFENMAEVFARQVGANYVFAPEFLEASPEILKERKIFKDFRALNGNAIVTRFPILTAKVIRLPACYDWFYEEEQRMLYDPDDKRMKPKNRVGEGKLNLIRRGGRNALIADLQLPNKDVIAVVSSQLENRAESKCRQRQLESTLHYMKTFTNPIIFGVDLNNIGKSSAPTTIMRTVEKTVKDPKFYIKKVISSINPFSWLSSLTSMTYGNYRKMGDPTVNHIPILLPNNAHRLFIAMHAFEFTDGLKFDFLV